MKSTYDRLQAEGRIGPLENISTDKNRPILQPRKNYRSEYPKLVIVGMNGKRPIKKLVENSHEELMLLSNAPNAPTSEQLQSLKRDQELASLRAENRALMEKLEKLSDEKNEEDSHKKANEAMKLEALKKNKTNPSNSLDSILSAKTSALEDFKNSLDEKKE